MHNFLGLINRFRRNKTANIAVTFALASLPILAFVGAAVDYTVANQEKARTQAVLDSAVLAGVHASTAALQIAAAQSFFAAQITNPWGSGAPTASFSVSSQGVLTGTATGSVKSEFLQIIGFPTIPIHATSAATITTTATANNVCILLVNTTASQSFLVNSGAVLNAPNCEIDVDSTAGTAGMINSGTTLNVKKVCIKGGATQNGGNNPVVSTGCAAISNPFVNALPQVNPGSCNFNNQTYNSGNVTINPGVYCGWTNFNGSGNLTLNPGLYIIENGGMTFNSSWTVTGSGITFYFVDQNATLQFNGNVTINLSAPSSGTYANILMLEPDSLPSSNLPIDGTNGSSIQGLLYLPSRNVTINSVSNVSSNQVTMVFSTLIFDALNWNFQAGVISMNGASSTTNGPARLTQ